MSVALQHAVHLIVLSRVDPFKQILPMSIRSIWITYRRHVILPIYVKDKVLCIPAGQLLCGT